MSEEFGVVARILTAEDYNKIQDYDGQDSGKPSVLTPKIRTRKYDQRICYIRFHCLKFTEDAKLQYRLFAHHEDNGAPQNLSGWTNFVHPKGDSPNYPNAKNEDFTSVLAEMVRDISVSGGKYKEVPNASLKNIDLRHRAYHVFMVDHDGWEFCGDNTKFEPGPIPIRFEKNNNFSFFDGDFATISLDEDDRSRHVFFMVNHRKQKNSDDDLPNLYVAPDEQQAYESDAGDADYNLKFDVFAKAPLTSGGKLIVIFDPGGNNGGNTFAPPPPP
jgi:hypothetical protein